MRPRKQEETVKDMGRQLRAGAQPHTNIMTDVGRMVGAAAAEAEVRKKCGSGRSGSQRACRKESLSAAEVALGAEGAARGSLSERRKCGSGSRGGSAGLVQVEGARVGLAGRERCSAGFSRRKASPSGALVRGVARDDGDGGTMNDGLVQAAADTGDGFK